MKKIFIVLSLICIFYFCYNVQKEEVVIPKESIRFRIIPNSNSVEDMNMKEKVKDEINYEIALLSNNTSLESARKKFKNSEGTIKKIVNETFQKNNYNKPFEVKYGYNYFPEKKYKGVTYKEGEYESLVVKIGEGKGDNFWCVLYPPLCMMEQTSSHKEYKFFVKEIINKFF